MARSKFVSYILVVAGIIVLNLGMSVPTNAEKIMIKIYNAHSGKEEMVEPVVKTDAEWQKILTPEQYRIARQGGTEQAFSKVCPIPKGGKGVYQCVCCGTDLFAYDKKFDSKTGWPSFWTPISELNVKYVEDSDYGMSRVEVRCARCGAHLGHVFDDGPPPTGKRYCINTVALKVAE